MMVLTSLNIRRQYNNFCTIIIPIWIIFVLTTAVTKYILSYYERRNPKAKVPEAQESHDATLALNTIRVAVGRVLWLTPLILATEELEIRRIPVRSQPGQKVSNPIVNVAGSICDQKTSKFFVPTWKNPW
jgi:hypothetical protein